MIQLGAAPSIAPGGVPDVAGHTAGASGGVDAPPDTFVAFLARAETNPEEPGWAPPGGDAAIDEDATVVVAVATPPIVLPVVVGSPAQEAGEPEAPGSGHGEGRGHAIDRVPDGPVPVVHRVGILAADGEPDGPAAPPRPLTSSAPAGEAAAGEVPAPVAGDPAGETVDTAPVPREAARTGVPAGQAAASGRSSAPESARPIASPASVEPGSTTPVAPEESATAASRPSHDQPVVAETRAGATRPPDGNGPPAARTRDAVSSAAVQPDGEAADGSQQERGGRPDGGQARSFGEWLRQQIAPSASDGGRQSLTHGPLPGVVDPAARVATADASFLIAGGQPADAAPGALAERDLLGQLVQSLRVQFRDGVGEAVLRLKPEHLGSISIAVRVENGGIRATVQAEAPAVRQWLESQQESLRSGLAEHGLRLERFVVNPDGRRESAAQEHGEERSPHRRQPRQASRSDEPVFEVVA